MELTTVQWAAIISAAFMAVGTGGYILEAFLSKRVRPVLASWIVIGTTLNISFLSYLTTPGMSIVTNSCNATSALGALGILVALVTLKIRRREKLELNKVQKRVLASAAGIGCLWLVIVFGMKGTGFVPNILMQILMIIGYYFTAEKLWKAEKNTESWMLWSCIALSSIVALYPTIVKHDWLALIYAARSTVCAGSVVLLMCKIWVQNIPIFAWRGLRLGCA